VGFFDQYKSINRATITKAHKIGTSEMLDESFGNPQWKDDAIQVVKKLLEFKVEQSRSEMAERLLGGLTTRLERLNAKRRQAGYNEIAERDLHELVRNRSAIFKRQLPDTFKGLLRHWLRDGEARALLVNTNTAAFLRSNDLITAAEVRTATPETGLSRQLFANDVARMLNSLENAVQPGAVLKTFCSSFTFEVAQSLKDFRRANASLYGFAQPSVKAVVRSLARASATGGLNRGQLLEPQTTIGAVNSLASLRSRIQQKGPGHAWMAKTSRQPLQTTPNWVDAGIKDFSGNIGASATDGTSHRVGVTTGFGGYEWIQEARNLFGPEIFEFGEHVSLADGHGLAAGGVRRSQRLSPDVEYIDTQRFGSYASGFAELRGARAIQCKTGSLDDRSLDTFDMLVMLSLNQRVCSWAVRFRYIPPAQEAEIPDVQIVNATHPDGVGVGGVARLFTIGPSWYHFPIRISRHSREVQFLMLNSGDEGFCPIVIPGIAGASQEFWPHKYFTVRFSWCQRTNFVTQTVIDETPWKCSYHRPEWVPPSRGY
jgi:hypothetical protein